MLSPILQKKLLLSIVFLLFCFTGFSQSFIIVSGGGLKRITLNKTGYTADLITGCANLGTIALYKNKLYTIGGPPITEATLTGNVTTDCKLYATSSAGGSAGMTVDEKGFLYYAVIDRLYKVDPATRIPEFLGTIPYTVGGDFIFFQKTLYMSSLFDGIVKVDINKPELSRPVISIPGNVFGMANVLDLDGKIKTYAFLTVPNGTDMLELDLINNKVVKVAYHLSESVGDAASDVESGTLLNTVAVTEQCDNPGKGQIQVNATSDKKPVYFSLNGGAPDTVGLYQNLSAGTYNIKITAPDTVLNTTAIVPDYSLNRPLVTFTATNAKCEITGQVQFQIADDASKYLLKFNNDTTALTKPVTGLLPGKYHFKVLRSNGCLYGSYEVTVGRTKCPIIVTDVAVAQQCDALLRGVVTVNTPPHAYTHTYNLEHAQNNTGQFSNVKTGDYQIKVTSIEDTVFVPVTVPDYKLLVPAFNVSQTAELCDLGGEIHFDNLGNNDKLFQIKMNDGSVYPFNYTYGKLHTGLYKFTFLDSKGCIVDTASVFLDQLPCSPVAFPNTFTPNGDGMNDLFRPNLDGYARQYLLHIYSRSGQEIFTSTDYFAGWPGTSRGKDAPASVYYWVVTFINDKKVPVTQKGWVTLMR